MLVFLNGKFVPEAEAVVPVSDRGFLLGDGLFETVRVAGGKPFRLAQHLERLARGAEFLQIRLPFTLQELDAFATRLIAENGVSDAVLRLTLTRGPGGRGYSPKGANQPTLVMTLQPLPPTLASDPPAWRMITSALRIPAGDALATFKTTSKMLNVLARAEAEQQGADEALLLNTNGEVAETAGGNVFWVAHGKICTVPAEQGALPGITRATVLEICLTLGLATEVCPIKPDQLVAAEGVFVTQSVWGVVPVASLDGLPVGSSPLIGRIAQAYTAWLARAEA